MNLFNNKKFLPVLIFVLVATILSAGLRYLAGYVYQPDQDILFTKSLLVAMTVGWGAAIAAVLSWKLFGKQGRTSTLFGSWPLGAILISVMPALVFAVSGYPNQFGINAHLAGLLFGLLFLFYALGEEIGWRGYMHDALGPDPVWVRGVFIAIAWWLWHLWFIRENINPQFLLLSAILIIPISILFSQIVSENHSWLATAGFHSAGNIAFMATMLEMNSRQRFVIAGIALALMIVIHAQWKKRHSSVK